MDDATATSHPDLAPPQAAARHLALVLAHSIHDPARIGELCWLPERVGEERVLGRHGDLEWLRRRPGRDEQRPAMGDKALSRRQVVFRSERGGATFENVGKLPLYLNGRPATGGPLQAGDLLQVSDRLLLFVVEEPELPDEGVAHHRFGQADPLGWVGESAASWAFRAQVEFVARRGAHVLITGPSGTGKELVARALVARSSRADGPFVSRNAATIPESLVDAELFGNVAGYPNPNMTARTGLIGAAHRGTLFLDEFGELPVEQQARLLRVLDSGEYTRLGEASPRKADLRLICATNRDVGELKHDVAARLKLRLETPALDTRRQDIPLLVFHLLRLIFTDDSELAARFGCQQRDAWPQVTVRLMSELLTHDYSTHVRELEGLLWQAITRARDGRLDVAPVGEATQKLSWQAPEGPTDPATLDPELIQQVLDRHGGKQDRAWRELGLSSRHVLARLIKRYDLTARGETTDTATPRSA